MAKPAVQVQGLWKKFRKGQVHDSLREFIPSLGKRLMKGRLWSQELHQQEFWALSDLNFEIGHGESVGIIGPNGAGKSTLLKVVSRILKPNRGRYEIDGRLSSLIEVGAGFHGDLSGRENIYLNGAILGMKRKEIAAKEEAIVEFAGVKEFLEMPVKRYSSGMRARLGFAVAAHMDPDILLIDEVLSVGDALFRSKCQRHMAQMLKSGVTVVFISHILDQVRALCPRTLVLNKGSAVYDGATDGAIRQYLQLLREAQQGPETQAVNVSHVRNIKLLDEEGKETLAWRMRGVGRIEMELVLTQPFKKTEVVVNISTVGGTYLGTLTIGGDDRLLPVEPGVYALDATLEPLVLAEGEFGLEFSVVDKNGRGRVWNSKQPTVVSVRGTGVTGPVVLMDGHWQMKKVNEG